MAKLPSASRVIFARVAAGLFSPLAGRWGLPALGTVTPKILQKMVWAGSNLGSYTMAEEAMHELGGVSVSPRRIRRVVSQVGNERVGLPLTSSHIESTIKQINRRVKGTEKFWSQPTSEAVLQLRADYLSDSAPLDSFWLRHQARQTGVNAYAQAP